MSVVSGSGACRMTLGTLASRYGYELVPPSSEGVTVTSLADEVDSVIPGSLYVPAGSVNMERLEHAAMRGATGSAANAAAVAASPPSADGFSAPPLSSRRYTSSRWLSSDRW